MNETLIRSFANTFFGYGHWSAPVWFVGMEEAGVKTIDDFAARVNAWDEMRQPELADLYCFHERIGAADSLAPSARVQKTWRPLIRALQVAAGKEPSTAALQDYQSTRLGRANGETALIELLPFPSSSTRDWLYGSLGIPEFSTRKCYESHLREPRYERLKERMARHTPRAVVFYGNRTFWRNKLRLQPHIANIDVGELGPTRLIATHHSTAHGTTNSRWDEIGRLLALA
jgi:hypothetical protein